MEQRTIDRIPRFLAALGAAFAAATVHAGGLVNTDPTKTNGDYIGGSGIPFDNFLSDSNGDVSVFLKVRARDGGQPLSVHDDSDVVNGQNYVLTMEFDTDPTTGESFITLTNPLFDVVPDASPQ